MRECISSRRRINKLETVALLPQVLQLNSKQDELANYLDAAFAKHQMKVTAKTNDDFNPFKRGEGILNYLTFIKRNHIPVNNYVILDDLIFDYRQTNLLNHLIKTNGEYGLQKSHIMKAISLLKANI